MFKYIISYSYDITNRYKISFIIFNYKEFLRLIMPDLSKMKMLCMIQRFLCAKNVSMPTMKQIPRRLEKLTPPFSVSI